MIKEIACISVIVGTLLTAHVFNFSPTSFITSAHYSDELNKLTDNSKRSLPGRDKNADLEVIRKRIVDDLLEPAVSESKNKKLIQSIQPEGTWPGINYTDVSRTGFEHRIHLDNMLDLSRAYRKPGSAFNGSPAIKKTVSAALDFWISKDFICDNWWWNEMGTPNLMINTLLLMDSDLTEKQRTEGARIAGRANLEASGARPGGDLIQIAAMLGKQGLFKRDATILDRVVKVMAEEIKITTDRGIKPDLGFHHRVDHVTSIHTYGTGYASAFSYWAVKIAGTSFTLPEGAMNLLIDYYLDGICRSMAFGRYGDIGARNRDLSRQGSLSPAGIEIPQNLLKASSYRKKELEEIVLIRQGEKKPALKGNRFFWHSEYFAHQRPAYFTSARMHSSRNSNVEQPHNEEGLKNHYFADGSNFISRTGKEYYDIFPVWDWQKIPGATIVQRPLMPPWKELAKKGLTDFVGGVSDGEFGAAAFDFASPHDPLTARKSWFFFDQEYVCLGAAITSESQYAVVTTLNQCLLNKDVRVKTANPQQVTQKGTHNLKGVSWVFHDSIAYIFSAPVDCMLKNTTASGNWREISHQASASKEPVQKEVFSLWIDHGTRPNNARYSYIVVPAISATAIDPYIKKSEIVILSNTPEIQSVYNTRMKRSQAVFYKAGKIKFNNTLTLTSIQPCIVMIDGNKVSKLTLSVSDPTRKLSKLNFEVSTRLTGSGTNWRATWDNDKKVSVIQVELPKEGDAGKTVIVELSESTGKTEQAKKT
ncbi:MAG: polysaccharide lyase family 8 super-sandwich domain-containing protein [Chitinophagaceae bacterium]